MTGGRLALGQKIADGWKATLTASYQKQLTHGAWDENPTIGGAMGVDPVTGATTYPNGPQRSFGQKNVARFGPEFKQYYAKTLDFHLEGDVGIGDLVYANTYWAQDDTLGERVLGVHAVREHRAAEQLHGSQPPGVHVPNQPGLVNGPCR